MPRNRGGIRRAALIATLMGLVLGTVEAGEGGGMPVPLFYASFDHGTSAERAAGEGGPVKESGVAFADGVVGKAVRLTKAARSILQYGLDKNVRLDQGSIALWYKSDTLEPTDRGGNRSVWRALFSLPRPEGKARDGSGALWLWLWGDTIRGDTSDLRDAYITSAKPIVPGAWTHIVFTWDADGSRLYVDGLPRTNPRDGFSPLKLSAVGRQYEREKHAFTFFSVGGQGDAEQADGLIDELRVFDRPLSAEAVGRLYTEGHPLDAEIPALRGLMQGKAVEAGFLLRNRTGTPAALAWEIRAPDGTAVVSGRTAETSGGAAVECVASLPAPAPGRHTLTVAAPGVGRVEEAFWVLRRENPYEAAPGDLKTTLLETVVPSPELGGERFLSVGELRTGTLDGRSYLEAGPKRGDRFAVRFRLPDAGGPYLVEWDYPDDKVRSCDVVAQSTRFRADEYDLQVGYFTGDEYRNTNRFLTQRSVYFPRDRDVTLVFMTARADVPAAAAEIRLYRIDDRRLPRAEVRDAPPVAGLGRVAGIYFEDPALNGCFAADTASMPSLETLLDRLTAYMKYSGQNLLAYPLVWYQGRIGRDYNPRHHADGFLGILLSKFDAENLGFLGTLNWHNLDLLPPGTVTEASVDDGSLHATPVAIYASGKPNNGGWHGTPPNLNILHPAVRKAVLDEVDDILAAGASHPSFKGLVLHLTKHCILWPGDIAAGYNDYAVEAFAEDTKTNIPVDRKDPMRGKLYADWLLANAREAWVDWRCRKTAELYREIAARVAARRPDLRLVVNSMIPVPELQEPRFLEPEFVMTKTREAGLDPKYLAGIPNLVLDQTLYPADYRWRAGGRASLENARQRLRDLDAEAATYRLLDGAASPWIHHHDRYWESAIGSGGNKHERSPVMTAPWFKEQTWRVSTLNPSGVHALKHYVLPLRHHDILGMTKGGFLVGTHGMEGELVPFLRAFRALPAKVFADLPTGSDTVKARRLEHDGATWFYVVNTGDTQATAEVETGGATAVADAATGAVMPDGGAFTLALTPYQLRSFKVRGKAEIAVRVRD